jgi:hypothetical protein
MGKLRDFLEFCGLVDSGWDEWSEPVPRPGKAWPPMPRPFPPPPAPPPPPAQELKYKPMNGLEAIEALTQLPVVARISVAKLQPDDVIVVECDDHISEHTAERLRECLAIAWPNHKRVLLGAGVHLKIEQGKVPA